jgi:hypothetical protein
LILQECCTVNVCAISISWKVISDERIHLNREQVLCGSESASDSVSLHPPPLDSFPSVLTPEDDLYVLPHTRTYNMTLVSSISDLSQSTQTAFPFPYNCLQFNYHLAAPNSSEVEETSSLSLVNLNASDRKFGHINISSSSSKPKVMHSLLKDLNPASLSELTPWKMKLCGRIWNEESGEYAMQTQMEMEGKEVGRSL